ncbi:HD-GYP domain-containing protein [Methylogaea oryzae]|uniref:HD-GYP domain-containing protein n=1 Tax=Methylogaea oryzae TaxID=1295382 RepID=UPI0006CF7C00|nr:HD domain-containing phosphohydrolase [Methylogaea oryzae]
MNDQAGCPVDPAQLAVAVFMHDIGMAFLPVEILHKRDPYTEEERWLLHSHPLVGVELLGRMPRWRPASDMVFQHHERSDGSGYPQGLGDEEICDGAKILGIVESFDARTQERAHRTLTKRPFIRAVLEINNCSGQLFSERWVQVFNDTVRTCTGRKRKPCTEPATPPNSDGVTVAPPGSGRWRPGRLFRLQLAKALVQLA